jgi:UDPglucose 6-dehydrogenase
MSRPCVGFAGMTHLGIVSAAGAAASGFRTLCFDPDAALVQRLRDGDLPVVEPGLQELLQGHAGDISYTATLSDLAQCDIVYISPDVPTDDAGRSDLSGIRALIDQVLSALAPHAVLVVLCQVPPGFTRSLPLDPSRRFYQVETLVFGRAVERATQPERFIVGCEDPKQTLPPAMQAFLSAFGCPLLPMRYESAELAKISINCCLVASVSVANTLAELSERIGADWGEIAPALKLDRRIGQHAYLAPGLGLAGGNLERDLATVLRMSESTGAEASLIRSFVHNSQHRRHWALRTLHQQVLAREPNPVIAVLGLAYKENTHSVKNSPSFALIEHLGPWKLQVFDPVVPASKAPHANCMGKSCALDALDGADVLILMTPWPEFRGLDPAQIAQRMRGSTVIDPYRILEGSAVIGAGLDYFTTGMPPLRAANQAEA